MDRKLYHLRKLEEIARGDSNFVRDMVVTFFENVTSELSNISTLKSAENWKSIAETSHKLASNFAYLGADSLHDLAVKIEKSVLNDNDLTGIAEKTDQLYQKGMEMLKQVEEDFCLSKTI